MNIANNEDSDPCVLRYVLSVLKTVRTKVSLIAELNYRRKAKTMKWKGIHTVAKILHRLSLSKSGLVGMLSRDPGASALNHAVFRGDIEIVSILLENGADPWVEDDLGMNAFDTCEKYGPFPRIKSVLTILK